VHGQGCEQDRTGRKCWKKRLRSLHRFKAPSETSIEFYSHWVVPAGFCMGLVPDISGPSQWETAMVSEVQVYNLIHPSTKVFIVQSSSAAVQLNWRFCFLP
jgi:hypothetical protein